MQAGTAAQAWQTRAAGRATRQRCAPCTTDDAAAAEHTARLPPVSADAAPPLARASSRRSCARVRRAASPLTVLKRALRRIRRLLRDSAQRRGAGATRAAPLLLGCSRAAGRGTLWCTRGYSMTRARGGPPCCAAALSTTHHYGMRTRARSCVARAAGQQLARVAHLRLQARCVTWAGKQHVCVCVARARPPRSRFGLTLRAPAVRHLPTCKADIRSFPTRGAV